MSVVTIEESRAMREFLTAVRDGAPLPRVMTSFEDRARRRCKRWGLAHYDWGRKWTITDEGKQWLADTAPPK